LRNKNNYNNNNKSIILTITILLLLQTSFIIVPNLGGGTLPIRWIVESFPVNDIVSVRVRQNMFPGVIYVDIPSLNVVEETCMEEPCTYNLPHRHCRDMPFEKPRYDLGMDEHYPFHLANRDIYLWWDHKDDMPVPTIIGNENFESDERVGNFE
jgi:hypothetical protein